jgi:RimJ/RimL family protein N-acetyltransferase
VTLVVTMDDQPGLIRWAEPRMGIPEGEMSGDAEALGVIDETTGEIQAVIAFTAHHGHFISAHIASSGGRRWATRPVLRAVFGYAFEFKGVKRMNCLVSVYNTPTQIMCLKLGFRPEATIRCGADDGSDGIVFGMLADECPWLAAHRNDDHEQEESAEA